MTERTHEETGTFIQPEESALVASEDGDYRLLLRQYADDEPIPTSVMLLAAVAMKARDPEWVEQLLIDVFSDGS